MIVCISGGKRMMKGRKSNCWHALLLINNKYLAKHLPTATRCYSRPDQLVPPPQHAFTSFAATSGKDARELRHAHNAHCISLVVLFGVQKTPTAPYLSNGGPSFHPTLY